MIILAGKNKNLPQRYFANVLDYLILVCLEGLFIFLLGEHTDSGTYRVTGFRALTLPLIWFLYFPLCESLTGQTIGKKAFDLYVVDLKGDSATVVQTFLRRMLDPIEIFLLGAPSILSINHSEKNQRIGDRLAGTLVVTTDAICRFCGAELELNTREVVNKVFHCPRCSAIN